MNNRPNWIIAFRSTLVLDSRLLYGGLLRQYRKQSDGQIDKILPTWITCMAWVNLFGIVVVSLTILPPLRWITNFCQYRNEKLKRACCCCCNTGCWFALGALHLIYCGGIIKTDWCELTNETYPACEWPKKVGISFLFYETMVFGLMAIYKINE